MWNRAWIWPRDRIGFGEKRTPSMISRFGSVTLDAGTEVWPFGSLIAPAGPGGGGGAAGPWTSEVCGEVASVWPPVFLAVTRTRSVEPWSLEVTVYVWFVAPLMSLQAAPVVLQRCHWYVNVGVVSLVHVPGCAVSTWPTCGVPVMLGGVVFVGAYSACAAVGAAAPIPLKAVTATTSAAVRPAAPSSRGRKVRARFTRSSSDASDCDPPLIRSRTAAGEAPFTEDLRHGRTARRHGRPRHRRKQRDRRSDRSRAGGARHPSRARGAPEGTARRARRRARRRTRDRGGRHRPGAGRVGGRANGPRTRPPRHAREQRRRNAARPDARRTDGGVGPDDPPQRAGTSLLRERRATALAARRGE